MKRGTLYNEQMTEPQAQQAASSIRLCSKSWNNANNNTNQHKATGYASDGVSDHNILNLPGSEWQVLGILTIIASFVRLYRLSQPDSVVFDEVQ